MFESSSWFDGFFDGFGDGGDYGKKLIEEYGQPKSVKETEKNGESAFEYTFETKSGDLKVITNYKLKVDTPIEKSTKPSEIERKIKVAVENEDYEEAARLRDIKNKNSKILKLKKELNNYIETENWNEVKKTVEKIIQEEGK